MTYPVPTG